MPHRGDVDIIDPRDDDVDTMLPGREQSVKLPAICVAGQHGNKEGPTITPEVG